MDLSIVFCVSSPEGIYSKYPSLIRLSEPGWTSIPKKGSILQKSSGLKPSSPMDGWYIYIHTHINAYIYIYTHRYYNNVTATWLEWRIGLRYAELFGSVNYLSPSMFFFLPHLANPPILTGLDPGNCLWLSPNISSTSHQVTWNL